MNKILINIYVPSIQQDFDTFVPSDMLIKELIQLLSQGIDEICNGRYGFSGREFLIRTSPESLLNPNKTLNDYNIKDGTKMIML